MHHFKKLGAALVTLILLSGCVTTYVTGQKIGTVDSPLEEIGVSINATQFQNSNLASVTANSNINSLFPKLAQRVPLVFELNGIQSTAVLEGVGGVSHELNTYNSVLRVVPKWASYSSRSGSSFEVGMHLIDNSKGKVIWTGSITLSTMGFGKFDEDLADEFARKVLLQLDKDGLVKLKGPEVVMPPKKEQKA